MKVAVTYINDGVTTAHVLEFDGSKTKTGIINKLLEDYQRNGYTNPTVAEYNRGFTLHDFKWENEKRKIHKYVYGVWLD